MSNYYEMLEPVDEDEFVLPEQALEDGEPFPVAKDKLLLTQSPRKRLEQLLEERRLQKELDDFLD